MEAYCTDLVEMLSHQGLYLGKSQSRERPYWSPWWHPHLDLNCKICVSSRRYIDKLRTVGNECMDINIRTYRKVIHKIPYESQGGEIGMSIVQCIKCLETQAGELRAFVGRKNFPSLKQDQKQLGSAEESRVLE